ncbi:hypothetical protein Emed_000877 [Eimeria media]
MEPREVVSWSLQDLRGTAVPETPEVEPLPPDSTVEWKTISRAPDRHPTPAATADSDEGTRHGVAAVYGTQLSTAGKAEATAGEAATRCCLWKRRITRLQQHNTIRSSSTDSSCSGTTNSNSYSNTTSTTEIRLFSALRHSTAPWETLGFSRCMPDIRRSQSLLLPLGQRKTVAFHSAAPAAAILIAAAVQPTTSASSDSICSTLLVVPSPVPLTTALP